MDELERAVEIERTVGSSISVADDRPIGMLAHMLWRVGEHDRSRALLLEALSEAVERGEERDRTGTLAMLSVVEQDAGTS